MAPPHHPNPRPRSRIPTLHHNQTADCSAPTQPRPGIWTRTLVRRKRLRHNSVHQLSSFDSWADESDVASTPQHKDATTAATTAGEKLHLLISRGVPPRHFVDRHSG